MSEPIQADNPEPNADSNTEPPHADPSHAGATDAGVTDAGAASAAKPTRQPKPRKSKAEQAAAVRASGREWYDMPRGRRKRGAVKDRTKEQTLREREEMARRYMRGESQYKIAAELGVTQQAVSHNIRKCREEWLKNSQQFVAERTIFELAKIDETERSAWEGWARSCKTATKTVKEKTTGEKPGEKERKEFEPQAGDPRFLDVVLRCVQQRCKILGLDAPTKIEDVTPTRTVEVLVESHDEVLTVKEMMESGRISNLN